jgi:hypothetical protein
MAAPADSATVIPATPGATVVPSSSPTQVRRRSRRTAIAALVVLIAAGGALAMAFVFAGKKQQAAVVPDAGGTAIVAAGTTVDAAVAARPAVAPDAGVLVAATTADAGGQTAVGKLPVDPKNPRVPQPGDPPPDAPPLDVIVKTSPAGGELFVAGDAAGTDGTTFHRPKGTKLDVKCTKKGYDPGRVSLAFDGSVTEVTCKMRRRPICKDDMKNPFDDCP